MAATPPTSTPFPEPTVRLVTTKAQVRDEIRAARARGSRTSLVPTMGSLHEGHLSLIRRARARSEVVGVSIFVNPLQFGAGEDLDRYPRDLDRDLRLAREAGADLVFAPPAAEMYPEGEPWVAVVPERGHDRLCGASRPGHFRGVLTVVAKLFGIFMPDVAIFGQKDYQQLTLIRKMVDALDVSVDIEMGPIVREPDGLAMSSRNAYLSADERARALTLYHGLVRCMEMVDSGEREVATLTAAVSEVITRAAEVEYVEIVDPRTLDPMDRVSDGAVCAVAARVGTTRLIDNVILRV